MFILCSSWADHSKQIILRRSSRFPGRLCTSSRADHEDRCGQIMQMVPGRSRRSSKAEHADYLSLDCTPHIFYPWCWGCEWHIPNKFLYLGVPTNLLIPYLSLQLLPKASRRHMAYTFWYLVLGFGAENVKLKKFFIWESYQICRYLVSLCNCSPRPPGGKWPAPFGPWCWGCGWQISKNKNFFIWESQQIFWYHICPCNCSPRPPGGTWPTPFGPWCWGWGPHLHVTHQRTLPMLWRICRAINH